MLDLKMMVVEQNKKKMMMVMKTLLENGDGLVENEEEMENGIGFVLATQVPRLLKNRGLKVKS